MSHLKQSRHRLLRCALGASLAVMAACGGDAAPATTSETSATPTGVPVHVDTLRRAVLDVIVTAPGRTEALREDRVRAPFPARLVALRVTDGDRVRAGEAVAEVVSRNSEAALRGAERMVASARTTIDSADAARAIQVARQGLVRQTLHATAAGLVLSHAAAEGDYVAESEVLLTIAEADAVFFNAQVPQRDLGRIAPGQTATIDMPAAGDQAVRAVVHGVLPSASSRNLSAPVRLDVLAPRPELAVGLFGTASIVVERRDGALAVPAAAVLTDDVSGTRRVAVVDSTDTAHWVRVDTGVRDGDLVELRSPALPPGTLVITDGQVGLPDSATVRIRP